MSNNPENTLRATFIPNGEGPGYGSLAAWCPWCESLHYHGAGGEGASPRIEERGAHCEPETASPFLTTGYDLRVTAEAKNASCLFPKAPSVKANPKSRHGAHHSARLYVQMNKFGRNIRQTILGAILGRKRATAECESVHLADGTHLLFFDAGAWWQVTDGSRTVAKGNGLPSVAAHLFGIPEEIAFIRIIEAQTGLAFDCEMLAALQQNFREWVAAGRPARRAR